MYIELYIIIYFYANTNYKFLYIEFLYVEDVSYKKYS